MYTDLFGKTRYKVNLHVHTTESDGSLSPDDVMELYRRNGYDALAITDHWKLYRHTPPEGLTLISGVEYNTGTHDCNSGVYHILGLGMKQDPRLEYGVSAEGIVRSIHESGGVAVLAHPAWSLNTPEQLMALDGIDATEIYNTVSGVHQSRRPDSSLILDMVASKGKIYPLLATDDAHYYDGTDECRSFIMAEAEENSESAILDAVKKGKFYASQGPEVHLIREGNHLTVRCSPVRDIAIHSNLAIGKHTAEGVDLTEAHFCLDPEEVFVRAEVTDKNGKRAWTNMIPIR